MINIPWITVCPYTFDHLSWMVVIFVHQQPSGIFENSPNNEVFTTWAAAKMLFINIRCSTVELMLRYPAPFMGSLIPLNFINYLCKFYTSHTWRSPIEPSGHHVDSWGGPPQTKNKKLTFHRHHNTSGGSVFGPSGSIPGLHWTSGGMNGCLGFDTSTDLFSPLGTPLFFFSERSGDFCFLSVLHGGCWIRWWVWGPHQPRQSEEMDTSEESMIQNCTLLVVYSIALWGPGVPIFWSNYHIL